MTPETTIATPYRATRKAAAPRRSILINLLAFWLFLQGAFGLVLALALVAGTATGAFSSGTEAGEASTLPLVFVTAFALIMAVAPLAISVGLVRRRRWSLILLIAFWALGVLRSVLVLGLGMASLPGSGAAADGLGTSLGGVAFSGAIQLLVIYALLRRADEFS